MKLALIGAAGQLGRDFAQLWPGELVPLTRKDVNLEQPDSIRDAIDATSADVVVNCAAYNFVDRAETEPELAFRINAYAPRAMAIACHDMGRKFVHISTDYVFCGDSTRTTPYSVDDLPGPASVYGTSKLAGELFTRAYNPASLIVRTCGLYGIWGTGGKGGNFVETMLKLGNAGKPLRVVNDQICTPTASRDLAFKLVELIHANASGVCHATNSGACSWYEFAKEIFEQSKMNVDLSSIPSSEYPQPARRPRYSVLDCESLSRWGNTPLQTWQAALSEYLAARKANKVG